MEDYTYLWYDVRPHPKFGTVEVRAMDAQTHVEHTLGAHRADPGDGQGAGRALRGGREARQLPVRDARREQVAGRAPRARGRAGGPPRAHDGPVQGARRAGSTTGCASTRRTSARADELEGIVDLLERGTGAHRQRVVYEANHDFDGAPAGDRRSHPGLIGARVESMAMASGPDLFVVCKSCGREVSPYITECPYCGNRLRKRAPKLERGGTPKPPKPPRKRRPRWAA